MLPLMIGAVAVAVMTMTYGFRKEPSMRRPKRPSAPATDYRTFSLDGSADLPCPWCQGATKETDLRCATCGQRFG